MSRFVVDIEDVHSYVVCPICGRKLCSISWSHAKSHGVTIGDIKLANPGIKLLSDHLSADQSKRSSRTMSSTWEKHGDILRKTTSERCSIGLTKKHRDDKDWESRLACFVSKMMKKKHREDTRYRETMRSLVWGKPCSPNKLEADVTRELSDVLEFVGDGKMWVTSQGKSICPDFRSKDRSKKKVVEIFGDYWHRNDNPNDRISLFQDIGWGCLVVWEHEWWQDTEGSKRRIQEFLAA